jgi:hypothetical protein
VEGLMAVARQNFCLRMTHKAQDQHNQSALLLKTEHARGTSVDFAFGPILSKKHFDGVGQQR